ncbi:nitrate- and nitrite sensing domain-containing protein [Streptomyces sp. NPDC059176]|uniref:sensor histidine kinase n=1 Tax=unclassified Streptomyces TaxID=2593676 RepID=UPI003680653C
MRTPRSTHGARPPRPSAAPQEPGPRGRRAHAGPPADEGPLAATGPIPGQEPSGGRRRRPWQLRPRTVRAKILCLLMVPVISLLALWGSATVTTAQQLARLRQVHDVEERIRGPLAEAVAALQTERGAALRQAAAPAPERAAALQQQAELTDAAIAKLTLDGTHTVADTGGLPTAVSDRLGQFAAAAGALRTLRTGVLGRTSDWDRVYAQYTSVIASAFTVTGALTGVHDPASGVDARVLLEFSRAAEMLAREDVLLVSARTAGAFTAPRLRLFAGAVETRRNLTESAAADLRAPERAAWLAFTGRPGYRTLEQAEDRTLAATAGRKATQAVPAATWDGAHAAVRATMRSVETGARHAAAQRAQTVGSGLLTPSGAAVVLGLAAVAASLVISVRIGRTLVVELVTLRNTALELARHELPRAMSRLRAGEDVDVHAAAPPGPPPQDEIAQVGEALATVHRVALGAAVERAELSRGISGVFVNLARRSQVLVHRQLTLLDRMERRADDPSELGDLFRLDHLTTRMRRHAESLIILSGAAPGRAWRMPVPLTNVVRAAVSEVEDYARIEVRQLVESSVIGTAVADLTHLIAELVENAAQFSPPHTRVRVSGEPVGNGYALEIEDRGLGMGKEALAEANRRIEQSESLDLFDSDRLGLFVVSKLSARHDVKVRLRPSPYGGTTAVVLIPTALLQGTRAAGDAPPAGGDDADTVTFAAASVTDAARAADAPPALRPLEALPEDPPPGVIALRQRERARCEDRSHDRWQPHDGPRPHPETSVRPVPQKDSSGLPRRVRQASLVPQLRETAQTPVTTAADDAPHDAPALTPEQARDRMAAYRDGWSRGGGAAPGRTTHGTEGEDA